MKEDSIKLREILLKSNDWKERRRAARLLGKYKSEENIKALVKALDDRDEDVPQAAILSLLKFKYSGLINEVIKPKIIYAENPEIRWAAAHAIGILGDAGQFEVLLELIYDSNWTVRNEAITSLDKLILQTNENKSLQNLKLLIRMLHIDYIPLHKKIVEAIVAYGSDAIEMLMEHKNIQDEFVKRGVIKALGEIADIHALEFVASFAKDTSPEVRKETVIALGKIGGCEEIPDGCIGFNTIIDRLSDGNPEVVEAAKDALVSMKDDEKLIPILIDGLNHIYNIAIRKNILEVMGRIKHPDTIIPIFDKLGNSYYVVRMAAAKTITTFGESIRKYINEIMTVNRTPIKPLIKEAIDADNIRIRVRAIKSLGQLKNPSAYDTLVRLTGDKSEAVVEAAEQALFYVRDAIRARENGAYVLGKLGGDESIPILLETLSDKSEDVRVSVISALREIRNPTVLKQLGEIAVNDSSYFVRTQAVCTIGDIGSFTPEVKMILLKLLNDSSRSVRAETVRILGRIPDDDVIDALIVTLKDKYYSVRRNALNALYNIGNKIVPKIKKVLNETDNKYIKLNALNLLGVLYVEESIPEIEEMKNTEKDKEVLYKIDLILKILNKKIDDKCKFKYLII